MKIVFQTASGMLRGRLPRVRVRLVGRSAWKMPHSQAKTSRKRRSTTAKLIVGVFRLFLLLTSLVSIGVMLVVFVPDAYYRVFPADTQPVTDYQRRVGNQTEPAVSPAPALVLPPVDSSLPEGQWLVIPRIGVRTQLQATTTPEEALQKGVWRVPDYGSPGDTTKPIIVAGHRFGWQWWWKTDYWKYNSFYNLPQLEVGDRIEVIAEQRKWTYEIYAGEEGEEITDYHADLILYTCKFLSSPIRYFRYARLVPPATHS